ncbi:hypothetical protein [Faecalibacterium langellae]|uniref:Uncharacterized protein n=1 Tax=Faecalibacterium langellae TaxID=3435293 RepID=A0ACC9CY68_9FIRM|nr:hypothetical protein [Faecalibacterium prausnitzii]PDX60760.1 hypothetical protein CGS49_12375 [Faecalibacterium prausnitzii]
MARPLAQRLAALTVVAALMAGLSVPAFAATYNIGDGSITIEANGDGTAKVTQNETVNEKDDDVIVKGSGETTSNVIEVINNTEDDLKITLSDVDIADTKGKAPLSVSGTGDTTIELDGNNSLTGSGWSAGLERNEEKDAAGNVVSGKLTIQDENKNGSLEATGNYGGAGIGGGNLKNSGEIEITGGTITATGALDGAGIGGGGSGGDGTVTISGGNITARGGSSDNPKAICGAGIGGGGGYGNATVTITGDAVIEEATGGGACAGIGSGYYNSKTDITISGNAEVKNAQGGAQGAGIGGGGFGGTGTVTITDNAKVDNATGGEGAAGIGSGVLGDVTVNISGNATVNAEGGANGAGIGGGYASAGDVTIEGGTTVKAEGGVGGGAGIGGGADLEADEDTQNRVTIRSSEDGSPDVTAVGGAPEPGEDGTELSKGGAGIGSGALIEPDEGDREADAIISIEGKVTIKSTAGKDNAAIGANGEEQVIEGLLPGSSIDRRDADGNDISLPGDKQQPADSSEQNSDALEGLTVTDAAGKTLPYTVEWQGSTVVVTAKYPFASLQMTHETLLQLQKQGAQTLRFCTESRTASASVAELLNVSMAGAKIVWSHDGAASALQVNGADHNELLK